MDERAKRAAGLGAGRQALGIALALHLGSGRRRYFMGTLPPRRNDQVFQLTLAEAAFTIVFLLLLLAGLMVLKAERDRDTERHKLDAMRAEVAVVHAKEAALMALVAELRRDIAQNGSPDLDEKLSELVKRIGEQARSEPLRLQLMELNARLTALEELRRIMARASPWAGEDLVRERIEAGIRALGGIESITGAAMARGREFEVAAAIAQDARRVLELSAENVNLRGQIAHLRRRNQAAAEGKGFGLPPCWVDESGHVQRLFDVTIADEALLVRPAWPQSRSADAAAIPEVAALANEARALSFAQFQQLAQSLYEWGKHQDPECRHYAQVYVAATRVDAAVRGKNTVYEYFYPAGREVLTGRR